MAVNKRPGTRISEVLRAFGIQPRFGCGCTSLAREMDKVGPDNVLEDLDEYSNKMFESIKKWRKGRKAIPQPPLFVVRSFIKWACS
jgi:hypothetical protein